MVVINKGEPRENRAKFKEHGLTFPVVLQQQWEISRRYAMFATPVAYLIGERGVVAVDAEAISNVMARAELVSGSGRNGGGTGDQTSEGARSHAPKKP